MASSKSRILRKGIEDKELADRLYESITPK
jgi:hypothetical protein